jgi:hypothetical protein
MKKMAIVGVVTFGVALLLAGAAWAHFPEGVMYYAFQFPDGMIPECDGDLSDWDIVPEEFRIRTEDLYEQLAGKGKAGTGVDLSDLTALIMLGWNPTDNKYYVGVQTYDNYYIQGFDRLEVDTDPDHSGGQYKNFSADDYTEDERTLMEGAQAQQHIFHYDPWQALNLATATWTMDAPYARVDMKFDGALDAEATTTYEVALTLWDNIDYHSYDDSDLHIMEEGQIIGSDIVLVDSDDLAHENMWEDFWTLSGMGQTFMFAQNFADVYLSPLTEVAAEPSSWGKIKASFE